MPSTSGCGKMPWTRMPPSRAGAWKKNGSFSAMVYVCVTCSLSAITAATLPMTSSQSMNNSRSRREPMLSQRSTTGASASIE